MKILFLGEIGPGQTSLMRMREMTRLGHLVLGVNANEPWKRLLRVSRQVQRRFVNGGVVDEIVTAARGGILCDQKRPGLLPVLHTTK